MCGCVGVSVSACVHECVCVHVSLSPQALGHYSS